MKANRPTVEQIMVAQRLREANLLRLATSWVRMHLTTLGIGNQGSREEMLERLHRQIWLEAYDDNVS
jgi:hypothetical protein